MLTIPSPFRRPEDWPEKFHAFIEARDKTPFKWGEHDCCLFAADCIREMIGLDPATKYRGQYDSQFGAMKLIEAAGGVEGIMEAGAQEFGLSEINVNFAQRGDILLYDMPDSGPSLGVCIGADGAFTGELELTQIPVSKCRRAWKVA